MDRVEEFLTERYANNHELKDSVIHLYRQYATWGLKDTKFNQDFTDGRDEHFYSYLWEMLLARYFRGIGLDLTSADEGPDFRINWNGRAIWVEAICPSPVGLPADWLETIPAGEVRVRELPHEQMLLRWTAALKEKKEQLTGRIERDRYTGEEAMKPGYLAKGTVGPKEPYVIAINACRLGRSELDLHHGISQLPFAVETAFPVGPVELVINRKTMQEVDKRHAYRPKIINPNSAEVPTDNFLNSDYASVSAVLGSPAGLNAACGRKSPVAIVHNPLAINALPTGILGADEEYIAEDKGDHYELHKVD